MMRGMVLISHKNSNRLSSAVHGLPVPAHARDRSEREVAGMDKWRAQFLINVGDRRKSRATPPCWNKVRSLDEGIASIGVGLRNPDMTMAPIQASGVRLYRCRAGLPASDEGAGAVSREQHRAGAVPRRCSRYPVRSRGPGIHRGSVGPSGWKGWGATVAGRRRLRCRRWSCRGPRP